MRLLRQAIAAGYDKADSMRNNTSLALLRTRPDFQLLIMDLEFPGQSAGSVTTFRADMTRLLF